MSNLQCSWGTVGQAVVWNAKLNAKCAISNNKQPCDLACRDWRDNQVHPACWNAAPAQIKAELGSQGKMTSSPNFNWSCSN